MYIARILLGQEEMPILKRRHHTFLSALNNIPTFRFLEWRKGRLGYIYHETNRARFSAGEKMESIGTVGLEHYTAVLVVVMLRKKSMSE